MAFRNSGVHKCGVGKLAQRAAWGLLLAGAAACESGEAVPARETPTAEDGSRICRNDTECPTGQRCEKMEAAGGLELAMVMPPTCFETQCTPENVSGVCFENETCVPIAQAVRLDGKYWNSVDCPGITQVCGSPCEGDDECAEGERCRESGQCELAACDEPEAPACPASMYCNPAVAVMIFDSAVDGVAFDPSFTLGIERGCVVIPCDQPDGVVCQDLWRCAPSETSDLGGCVPIPCQESGECSSESMICNPTSEQRRPSTKDAHGCVARNCEEGLTCTYTVQNQNVGYCDFDGPHSTATGCAALPCDEVDGLCYGALVCDRESPLADERGCRRPSCTEGTVCPGQYTCEPTHPSANDVGCVAPTTDTSTGNSSTGNSTALNPTTANASDGSTLGLSTTSEPGTDSGAPPETTLPAAGMGVCRDSR